MPANTKIDGKATEWNNQFTAHSKNNFLSYTVANDNDHVYVIIRLNDYLTIDKAITGGITFSFGAEKKKQISVAYLQDEPKSDQMRKLVRRYHLKEDPAASQSEIAGLPHELTQLATQLFKRIKVTGVNGLQGDTIAVYNDEGIEITTGFDKDMAMITEIRLPVKHLIFLENSPAKLNYTIKLNGIPLPQKRPDNPANARVNKYVDDFSSKGNFYRYSPAVISGEYVLQKK